MVVVGAGFIGLEFAAVARAAGVGGAHRRGDAAPDGAGGVGADLAVFHRGASSAGGRRSRSAPASSRILGAGGRVDAVELDDGRVLPADLVLVCIGVAAQCRARPRCRARGRQRHRRRRISGDRRPGDLGDRRLRQFPDALRRADRVRLESVQNGVDQARAVAARIAGKGRHPTTRCRGSGAIRRELKLQIAGMTAGHDLAACAATRRAAAFRCSVSPRVG